MNGKVTSKVKTVLVCIAIVSSLKLFFVEPVGQHYAFLHLNKCSHYQKFLKERPS